jgi:hypothetical protein
VSDVLVQHLNRPFDFRSPWPRAEFALLLVIRASDVSAKEQWALSAALVEQGCRYAVCVGIECSTWDDSIDYVCVRAEIEGRRPESRLVMTTWHENESMEDVVDFYLDHTAFDDFLPEHHLVLQVGGSSADLESLEAMLRAAAADRIRRVR